MSDITMETARPPESGPRGTPARGRYLLGLVTGAVVLLLAGCSSSGNSAPTSTSTSAPTTSTAAGATTSTAGAPSTTAAGPTPVYEVRTGTVPGLGKVLVDGQGFTLYLFVPDKQSGQSTCYSACAQAWPPLLLPAGTTVPPVGKGVIPSLLGTTKRSDGTTQITYNKWPLYLWVSDSEPGQATGQGLNNLGGLWYVLSPQGKEITTTP